MTPLTRGLGAVLAAAAMAALAWGSTAPMTVRPSPDAVLRLAWSARPERIENCREQSAEELARLPAHMRQPVACEGTTAQYRLQVRVGGALVTDRIVHGGGLRRDRRLYVFEELPLPAGEADVEVRFDRLDSTPPGPGADEGGPAGRDRRDRQDRAEAAERQPRMNAQHGESIAAHSSLAGRFRFASRRVILVTYDAERRRLTAVHREP